MMFSTNGERPVYYYRSTDSARWKVQVYDLLVKDVSGNTFTALDPTSEGVHFATARVDTFYRAMLIPSTLFPQFMTLVDNSFNKTVGPAQGQVFCDDGPANGNCYVENMTCAQARPSFREYYLQLSDLKAYTISPDNYLLDTTLTDSTGVVTNYCELLIQRNNIVNMTTEYVLGMVFLYDYYLVLDFDNLQVGFNGLMIDLTPVVPPSHQSFPYWIIIVIVVAIVMLIIAVVMYVRIRNKRLQGQLTAGTAYSTL